MHSCIYKYTYVHVSMIVFHQTMCILMNHTNNNPHNTGRIVGIDEETAFSWPTCDRCGNSKLGSTADVTE